MQTEAQNVVGKDAAGSERLARRNRPLGPITNGLRSQIRRLGY